MLLIVLVGNSGSGKTSLREHLQDHGFLGFEAGTYADKICDNSKKSNLDFFMKHKNRVLVAKAIYRDIKAKKAENIVISGLRIPEEIIFLRKRFKNMYVIGLYAPENVCYRRTLNRKNRVHFPDLKTFILERMYEDYAHGLGYVFYRMLDFTIDNEKDDIEIGKKQLDDFLKKVRKGMKE